MATLYHIQATRPQTPHQDLSDSMLMAVEKSLLVNIRDLLASVGPVHFVCWNVTNKPSADLLIRIPETNLVSVLETLTISGIFGPEASIAVKEVSPTDAHPLAQFWHPRLAATMGAAYGGAESVSDGTFQLSRPTSERARLLFSQCHRAIWEAEVSGPLATFMAFVKVMFVKLWADKQLRENHLTRSYFEDGKEVVLLPSGAVVFSEQWIEQREAEGTVNPVDTILFEKLREDIEREIQKRKKKRIFDKNERIGLKPETVREVVRRLQGYDMFGIDEDLNGRLFETFLSATMRGRQLGQFFTPRSVVKMASRMAGLHAGRDRQDRVIDACCGSGGFLIEALTLMRNRIRENDSLSPSEKADLMEKVSTTCIYGVDAGKSPPLARIARINMYLHGDGGSRIYFADGLDKALDAPAYGDPEDTENVAELQRALENGLQFDFALTNPPFSMAKKTSKETERAILERYDLARKSGTETATLRPSLRSSIMYFERYWDILRVGGRLITVIDDTLLASVNFSWVRDYIRDKYLVRAIISLPGDAFKQAGSRVKTSVLILEKKADPTDAQPSCFGYFSESLGVDNLTPRASEVDIRRARERAEKETDEIVNGFDAYLSGRGGGLILDPSRLTDRLDLKYCAPDFGRMIPRWRKSGAEIVPLCDCVEPVKDEVIPSKHPEEEFTLLKVTYGGVCEVEKVRKGKAIKAKKMSRVYVGQLVFSTIRATDGAIGVVPKELDGALVSGSYTVFNCGSLEETAYLWAVLRSYELRADMQSISSGSGRYTTCWPEVGQVLIPRLPDAERRTIGQTFIESWRMEKETEKKRADAQKRVAALGVESKESIKRWKASKAPT